MDGGETDTGQGAGVETAPASSSSDDVNDLAVGEDGGRGAAPAPMIGVLVAISMKRPGPRMPRPRRRRAVVRPPAAAAGSDHGARRTKEFMQWREWYLRKQRREKERAWLYCAGIPPPGT